MGGNRIVVDRVRFEQGDFPMVSVVSGQSADVTKTFTARPHLLWPWLFFLDLIWVIAPFLRNRRQLQGGLPIARGEETSAIKVSHEKGVGVIVKGAHPAFADAVTSSVGGQT